MGATATSWARVQRDEHGPAGTSVLRRTRSLLFSPPRAGAGTQGTLGRCWGGGAGPAPLRQAAGLGQLAELWGWECRGVPGLACADLPSEAEPGLMKWASPRPALISRFGGHFAASKCHRERSCGPWHGPSLWRDGCGQSAGGVQGSLWNAATSARLLGPRGSSPSPGG